MKKTLPIVLRILSIVLQLGYVKSYTHYLTLTELGYSFYLTALSAAINALILVPADFYQQAHLSAYYDGIFPLGSVISLNKKILLMAAALAAILGTPVCIAGKLSALDLLLIFGLAIFLYFSTSFRNYLNNRGHGLFTGWMLFLEAALKIISFLVFVIFGMSHISAFVLSTIVAFMVEVLCLAVFFYHRVPFTRQLNADMDFKSLLKTSSAVSFSALCNWLQLQGYRVVYVWLGFPEVAGLYAAVSNLGTLGMNACSTVFSQMLLPRVYGSKGSYIFQYVKYALLLCLIVVLGYLAFGKILLFVLTKKEFVPFARLMLFGILVEAGNLLVGAASTYFTIRHTPFHLIAANIAGLLTAALGLSICLVWHPHNYYLLGSVLALSQAVVCVILFYEARSNISHEVVNV
jgi:O-antigen/teichoic acid export membrane protein